MSSKNFSLKNLTKGKLPSLPFVKIKESVLGKNYSLSLVVANGGLMQKLNREHRKLNKPTDILSFSLGKNEGEIFLCPKIAKLEAVKFDRTYKNFLSFLFIHGLYHLKGFAHGSRMESEEIKIRRKFNI